MFFFLWELLAKSSLADVLLYDESFCYAGAKSWRYFTIQLMKILLEMVPVTVYASGPPRKHGWFYSRYSMLILSLLVGSALLVLVWLGQDGYDMTFMMLPRVSDSKLALPFTNLVHAICVSVMVLLETVRLGWPLQYSKILHSEME